MLKQLLKLFLKTEMNNIYSLNDPKHILVVWQHNQLGDLIVSYPLYRAIKEKYPNAVLTVVLSPANYRGLQTCRFIDNLFIYDKRKLKSFSYLKELVKLLRSKYDVAIVPSVVSISFTSNLLAGLSKSKIKIGPNSLNGAENEFALFFNSRIDLDWRDSQDKHVAERTLDIVRPFGIITSNFHPEIKYNESERKAVLDFFETIEGEKSSPIIGLHIGAGKPQNRWSYSNFADLINGLNIDFKLRFYFTTGGKEDNDLIDKIRKDVKVSNQVFDLMGIPKLCALIDNSDLYITNDTGPMHVAAATDTPVISLFGPTNPKMWAPLKEDKFFIKKSENINDITVDDVYKTVKMILFNDNK